MSTEAYGLEPRHLLALVMMQCVTQGTLIPMLTNFLVSKSAAKRPTGLKIYVILVNALGLTQTIIAVLQGFEMLDTTSDKRTFVIIHMYLTVIICTLVQAFFTYRCWKIFGKRILPIVPFLILLAVSFVSGIMVAVCGSVLPGSKLARNRDPALAICVGSSFILDLLMTTTTIIFIYRTQTGLSEHDSLFTAIWRIIWASAAPPLVVMSVIIINGYIVPGGPLALTVLSSAMNAKVFTLSLMISLLGQSHVRRQLGRSHPSHRSHVEPSRDTIGVISEPVFARIVITTTEDHSESSPPLNPLHIAAVDLSQDSLPSDHSKTRLEKNDAFIEKPKETQNSHVACLVHFPEG
ncbi:hypothetical protein RSOLAG22IIIB_13956 [Rhizoctonia solani]|uniref:Uncharacterized protein n=1 Tax=Rhizoctonia solani TaxID=456999 RepID=A0A0K6FSJ8_9AGAM|nr:hypothetical protein RSOLAG22IIIB_13956 [Rhizoctonia solani]